MQIFIRVATLAGIVMTSHALGQKPVFMTEGTRPIRSSSGLPATDRFSRLERDLAASNARLEEAERLRESYRQKLIGAINQEKNFLDTFFEKLLEDPSAKLAIDKAFPNQGWKSMSLEKFAEMMEKKSSCQP